MKYKGTIIGLLCSLIVLIIVYGELGYFEPSTLIAIPLGYGLGNIAFPKKEKQ